MKLVSRVLSDTRENSFEGAQTPLMRHKHSRNAGHNRIHVGILGTAKTKSTHPDPETTNAVQRIAAVFAKKHSESVLSVCAYVSFFFSRNGFRRSEQQPLRFYFWRRLIERLFFRKPPLENAAENASKNC